MTTPVSFIQYPSDGANKTFGVPFPFILREHVRLAVDWSPTTNDLAWELQEGTDYAWDNDSQITLTQPIPAGETLSIFRDTPSGTPIADFSDGSTLLADDLDLADLQTLYVAQEIKDRGLAIGAEANTAQTVSAEAKALAQQASTDSSAALTAANSAQAASAAASASASQAVTAADAATAASNTATQTANSAMVAASAAESSASSAVTTADQADAKAQNALDAVSSALPVTLVTDVASIPGDPTPDELVEVGDSTGIEGFTPLSGLPTEFVGDPGLRVRIQWTGTTWEYRSYEAADPDTRYARAPLPIASTSQAGLVQLSTATGSNAQDTAATPSAVKAAYDVGSAAASAAATADGKAVAAQSAADAAQSTANGAQSSANAAQSSANAAQNAADTAQLAADSAIAQAQQKVSKAGDTMTGNLIVPSINFPSSIGGRRNMVLNPTFDVWMNGIGNTQQNGWMASQWASHCEANDSIAWSRQVLSNAAALIEKGCMTNGDVMRVNRSGSGNGARVFTKIENFLRFSGALMTASFYLRAQTNGHQVKLFTGHNVTGAGAGVFDTTAGQVVTLTTDWERYDYTFTVPIDSITSDKENTSLFLGVVISGAGVPSTDDYVELGGVQLEYGPVATPLAWCPPNQAQVDCQRYRQNLNIGHASDPVYSHSHSLYFPTPMRAVPTISNTGKLYWINPVLGQLSSAGSDFTGGTGYSTFNLSRNYVGIFVPSWNTSATRYVACFIAIAARAELP